MAEGVYELTDDVKTAIDNMSKAAQGVYIATKGASERGSVTGASMDDMQRSILELARSIDRLFDWRDAVQGLMQPASVPYTIDDCRLNRVKRQLQCEDWQ